MDNITIAMLLAICACSWCAYMIGINVAKSTRDDAISDTITYLCVEGYIRHYQTDNGELEILKLNGDDDGQEEDSAA